MSSARSRAERAEIGRASIGDDGVEGGSRMGGGGLSTASMTEASAAGSGSGGGEEEVEASTGGPEEIVRSGGGVGAELGGLGMKSFWLAGLEPGRAAVSVSSGVSLSGVGTSGAGTSGIKAGGGVNAGQAGMVRGGGISTAALESGIVGMFGRRAFGVEVSGPGDATPKSEGTGMSGACTVMSELGVSRMGSAGTSTESLFDDFLKPRKPFLVVVALGGGVAGTSSAVLSFDAVNRDFLSLPFSFFCF